MTEAAVVDKVEGVERVIEVGVASYWNVNMMRAHGLYGDTVRVHPDHVEAFDRLNQPPRFTPDPEVMKGGIVDASKVGSPRRRKATPVEQRIMDGIGDGVTPVTERALSAVLAADERERDAARKPKPGSRRG